MAPVGMCGRPRDESAPDPSGTSALTERRRCRPGGESHEFPTVASQLLPLYSVATTTLASGGRFEVKATGREDVS